MNETIAEDQARGVQWYFRSDPTRKPFSELTLSDNQINV